VTPESQRFFRAFLRNPAKVGAIAPSSRSLARAMFDRLNLEPDDAVIEFGPGTGSFTRQIRANIANPACYLGIELDRFFVRVLRRDFPDFNFVKGSAEQATEHYERAGLGRVGAIISGLPFASLPGSVQDGIIGSVDQLMKPGCVFRTFQYVHSFTLPSAIRFRKRMNRTFGPHHRSRVIVRNLPPAFILTWERQPSLVPEHENAQPKRAKLAICK